MKIIKIISYRKYGEPKLKTPKELSSKNLIGTVEWGPKKIKCKVWMINEDIYLHHRDFFSNYISKTRAKELGIIKTTQNKFVYNDNFGSVVLRNEAILKFNLSTRKIHNVLILGQKQQLKEELSNELKIDWVNLEFYWDNLFDSVIKLVNNRI